MRQFSLFLKGALLLTAAGLLSRFLGFFYKIFLAHALGAEGMGIYQLIFPVFAVCHALTASGIETALARFTACSDQKDSGEFLRAGLVLSLAASCAAAFVLWGFSEPLAVRLLHESRCAVPLQILACSLPLSAVHCCFSGFCLGRKKAGLPAAAQLVEQAVRIGAVWVLCAVYAQEGRAVTPVPAVLGLLAGEAGSALFMLTFSSGVFSGPSSFRALLSKARTLLSMAVPLTGTRLSLTLLQSAEAVLIPVSLRRYGMSSADALSLYGILTGMSLSFLMFPNAVTGSISAMLLPVISEEQARGNEKKISLAVEGTLLFGLSMGILCMGLFLYFGRELGEAVFHEPLAGEFLRTLAWICPFLYLTGNLNSILHGLGKTSATFFNQLAAVLVRILFLVLFVPFFGIQGVLWSILASQLLLCVLGLLAVSPHVTPALGLDLYVIRPAAAMILSIGGVHLLKQFRLLSFLSALPGLLALAANIALAAVVYLALLLLFGGLRLLRLLRPGRPASSRHK
ncbi:MAG: oligosaccharide flippase family protein [Eubacteriales bacterium]|nr:oligosaccharide flippase family protein [Eubacteriales bacterium]